MNLRAYSLLKVHLDVLLKSTRYISCVSDLLSKSLVSAQIQQIPSFLTQTLNYLPHKKMLTLPRRLTRVVSGLYL